MGFKSEVFAIIVNNLVTCLRFTAEGTKSRQLSGLHREYRDIFSVSFVGILPWSLWINNFFQYHTGRLS